ncbi:T9SS type A sorting domain-containing protein, partial [uncultured Fibrobacter sp.]|uniref:T9SS type A sorting domain-containing protein n=1 Tax=uncultured Fibrobacter sp. TaxID=261512 RepID=UPI00261377A6
QSSASESSDSQSSDSQSSASESSDSQSSDSQSSASESSDSQSSDSQSSASESSDSQSSDSQSSASESSDSQSSDSQSSSSESTLVSVEGSLEQSVERGDVFKTITFSNVQSYNRDSWNIYFLDFVESGDKVIVSGTIPDFLQQGSYKETLTINNQKFNITVAVTVPVSSSSSEPQVSSSSETSVSSSSEITPESSSGEEPTLAMARAVSRLSLVVSDRVLHVSGATDMSVVIFDMQGSPVATFAHVSSAVNLDMLRQGNYVVRLRSGSDSIIRRITVK